MVHHSSCWLPEQRLSVREISRQRKNAAWMAFAFYAVCMVGQLAWAVLVMPETKGLSLEKIQEQLHIE